MKLGRKLTAFVTTCSIILSTVTFSSGILQSTADTTTQTLLPQASTWKYLDTGIDQGTAWQSPTFSDGAWASGAGVLGFKVSGASTLHYNNTTGTIISFGPDANNKYITTYFRSTFNIADKTTVTALTGYLY